MDEVSGLQIEFTRVLSTFDDEEDFLGRYSGKIFEEQEGGDEGEESNARTVGRCVGRMEVVVFDAEAAREQGVPPVEALDYQGATAPYTQLYSFEDEGNFAPAVLRVLKLAEGDCVFTDNALIIDRLELDPKVRGRGNGLACIRSAIRHLGIGCRVAAIKPFPLQCEASFKHPTRPLSEWRAGLGLDKFSADEARSTAKLRKYYSKLGFKAVRDTDLMVLDLDRPQRGLPTLDDVLR